MQSFLEIFDIYLLEAMVNGILLGGLLALLALGLNLIFGVIDVTWICYAELVMIGMYGMYFLVQYYGLSYYLAAPLAIVLVAILGALLHYLVIAPLLVGGADQPAAGHRRRAVRAAELRHRGLRRRLPQSRHPPAGAGLCRHAFQLLAAARLRRGADRHGGGLLLHDAHLHRHRHPRDLAGPPDHGADGRRHEEDLPHHLGAGRRAGRPGGLPAGAAVRRPSLRRPVVRADHLPDLRAGRAGQFRRRLRRGLRVRRDHLAGRALLRPRMGLCAGLRLLHRHDVRAARRACWRGAHERRASPGRSASRR